MAFERIDLHPRGNDEGPGVGVGREDPQVGALPDALIKGVRDGMATLDPRRGTGAEDLRANRMGVRGGGICPVRTPCNRAGQA